MAKRRRSLLAAAASVVGSALAGCVGDGGNGNGTNQSNQSVSSPTGELDRLPAVDSSFPQYQYDAENTGAVSEGSGPTGAISSLFEFDGAGPDRLLGSPAVADGTVYVVATTVEESDTATTLTESGTPETVTGTDTPGTATGSETPGTATGSETPGTATGSETPATATDSETPETVVYAINAVAGTVDWETTYAATGAAGPTAVADDYVLAPVGGNVVALDSETGDQQWTYACGLASGITVDEGSVYVVGTASGVATLYSLSTDDGTVNWETELDAETAFTTPAVADGTVYVGGTALQALDTADGSEQWRADTVVSTAPAIVDDSVVVGSGASLRVYDTTGTEQWSVDLGSEESPVTVTHSPAVADDTVYLSVAGEMRAYDLADGEQAYAVTIGMNGTPVVADGYCYLFGAGQLVCLDADDGETEWAYGTQQHTDTGGRAPAVLDNVAYFPAEQLYAITE